jgi:hypothetical protein
MHTHSPIDETNISKTIHEAALEAVAFGRKDELKVLLEQNIDSLEKLLLSRESITMPSRLVVEATTLAECAFGIGDPELIELITNYFTLIKDGKQKLEEQKARYRPCIEAMAAQKPDDDLTPLFNALERATLKDVEEELKTKGNYNKLYQSEIRQEYDTWINKKFDPERRNIKEPRMHCNYQNYIHAGNLLRSKWDALKVKEENKSYTNYIKHYFVAKQIMMLIELTEFPEDLRYIFKGDQIDKATIGKDLNRSFEFKSNSVEYQIHDDEQADALDWVEERKNGLDTFSKLLSSKYLKLSELMQ